MLKNFKRLINELGLINSILYSTNRFCNRFSIPIAFIKYYLAAQEIHAEPLLPNNKGRQLTVIELPSSLTGNHPCPRPISVLRDRYAQGAACLAAYKEEEFAGCLWYVKEKYQEDEVRCVYELISKGSVWDFDVYVEPKFRLSPVFLKLWDEASRRLLDEGYRWSLSRISAFNAMSLSSHKRMGAQIIGWALFICLGRLQFTISNVQPYLHFSFKSLSMPVFKLNAPN